MAHQGAGLGAQFPEQRPNLARPDNIVVHQRSDIVVVFLATLNQFADGDIDRTQAKRQHSPCILVLKRHQPSGPRGRQHGGVGRNAVGVVAKSLVEEGELAQRTCDQIGLLRGSNPVFMQTVLRGSGCILPP